MHYTEALIFALEQQLGAREEVAGMLAGEPSKRAAQQKSGPIRPLAVPWPTPTIPPPRER